MSRPGSERAANKSKVEVPNPTEQQVKFVLGPPKRPNITHDDNLHLCPRREPTSGDRWDYMRWGGKLTDGKFANFFGIRNLPDALPAYEHYRGGSGADREFSYYEFVEEDPSGHVVYLFALLLARQAAERLYRDHYEAKVKSGGTVNFQMTGGKIAVGGKDDRFPYPQTENWQKTIGAHSIWVSANVRAWVAAGNPVPTFEMAWTIHAEDKYNFNPGQEDIATGLSDNPNWMFECVGLGKSYMHYGTMFDVTYWTGATRDVGQVMYNAPGTW
jgi:hypothetical protein